MDLGLQLICRPGDDAAPVVLGVLPDDLDEIQLGRVGWQEVEDQAMIEQPLIPLFLGNGVVDGCVIQHHDRKSGRVRLSRQTIHEANHRLCAHRTKDRLVPQTRLLTVLQGAQHIEPLTSQAGIGDVGLAQRQPSTLNIGKGGKLRAIHIEQIECVLLGPFLKRVHGFASAGECLGVVHFFRLRRVRLKLMLRAFRPIAKRPRLNDCASGWTALIASAISRKVMGCSQAQFLPVSSIAAVNFAGLPPLWPTRIPASPLSSHHRAQLRILYGVTFSTSDATLLLCPFASANRPRARCRTSPCRWWAAKSSRAMRASSSRLKLITTLPTGFSRAVERNFHAKLVTKAYLPYAPSHTEVVYIHTLRDASRKCRPCF